VGNIQVEYAEILNRSHLGEFFVGTGHVNDYGTFTIVNNVLSHPPVETLGPATVR
jgi:hypothetical protein